MKKILYSLAFPCLLSVMSCGGQRKDAAYYAHMIDSIRQTEQVKMVKEQAGVYDDPVEGFFDTLALRPLPMQSVGADKGHVAFFTPVPKSVASRLGYPVDVPLRALSLPRCHGFRMLLLAEMADSVTPTIQLLSLDRSYEAVDELRIYAEWDEDKADNFGKGYLEFFITSDYEITLIQYFLQHNAETPHVEQARRFLVNKEGRFEETIIEY